MLHTCVWWVSYVVTFVVCCRIEISVFIEHRVRCVCVCVCTWAVKLVFYQSFLRTQCILCIYLFTHGDIESKMHKSFYLWCVTVKFDYMCEESNCTTVCCEIIQQSKFGRYQIAPLAISNRLYTCTCTCAEPGVVYERVTVVTIVSYT